MQHGRDGVDRHDHSSANGRARASERTPLLSSAQGGNDGGEDSSANIHIRIPSPDGQFFENVAAGIQAKDRERLRREVWRYGSFAWAIISCLCAGSITAYSLYGHLFQERLHYTQFQVNLVAVVAEVALYLPVACFGFVCDRYGPRIPSLLGAFLFGGGYFLAAFTYRAGPPPAAGGDGYPVAVMVLAFVGVGMGTCCMYLAGVTTCAKNFGHGKHKGFALAAPIASFGLGGMWQSQVGSRLLYERNADQSRGDVDCFRFFCFLGGLLLAVGIIGSLLLRIVDEKELIASAVEDLEQSGLLEHSDFFRASQQSRESDRDALTYGTSDAEGSDNERHEDERRPFFRRQTTSASTREARRLQKLEEKRKKSWLLNGETRRFLTDPTMWWLAAGFFLVTGPGEAFINNLGTIIGTLYPPPDERDASPFAGARTGLKPTSAATHVSIVAVLSTIARLLAGTLSDLLSPPANPRQHLSNSTLSQPTSNIQHRSHANHSSHSVSSSLTSLDPLPASTQASKPAFQFPYVSRLILLLVSTLLLSLGLLLLATGVIQNHAAQGFWAVSALVGLGYGAAFSLVPIIISCVWGVENFGTNWGVVAMMPAFGAAVWGAVYAAVYEWGAGSGSRDGDSRPGGGHKVGGGDGLGGDQRCYGTQCYALTFWLQTVCVWIACGLWIWAWRGPRGWKRRGVAV